jgi:hypothetical protein
MKSVKIDQNISYYTNFINKSDEYLKIITANNLEWKKIFNGHQKYDRYNRDNNNVYLERAKFVDYEYQEMSKKITEGIVLCLRDYQKAHNIENDGIYPNFISVDKYLKNTNMVGHVDSIKSNISNAYTVLLYINSDYEGGEISFKISDDLELKNKHLWNFCDPSLSPTDKKNIGLIDYWIKPESFSLVIFPPSWPYYHATHSVVNGNKFVSKLSWTI